VKNPPGVRHSLTKTAFKFSYSCLVEVESRAYNYLLKIFKNQKTFAVSNGYVKITAVTPAEVPAKNRR
jgi:hypothetical protein